MRVEIEFDEETYKRSVAKYFEETLRPVLAGCVDKLAANAVKRLETLSSQKLIGTPHSGCGHGSMKWRRSPFIYSL